MIAMVLTAGFGTRLRPLTTNKSKVALSLAGVPVIVRVVRMLRQAGFDKIVVNLHHAPASVRDILSEHDEEVVFSHETEILGTGGALWGAREHIAGSRVILVNGDCYYGGPDLSSALEFHESRGALATMVLADMPAGEHYRGVEIGSDGRLIRIAGRPESTEPAARTLHFTGIHILEPEFVQSIGPGFSDINSEHYPRLIGDGGAVYGCHTVFDWFDLGTPGRFLSAAASLIGGGQKVIMAPGCDISSTATLTGPLELGPGCRVGENALVAGSVLERDVVVEPGARVVESLIGDSVRVAAGTRLDGAVAAVESGNLQTVSWKR